MNNQHAGLSQALATQRITERHQQAAHARLRGARPPRRRRTRWAARRWWQLAHWPVAASVQPVSRPHSASYRSEATMSKLARALILAATLAAMNLAGMTAVAHAQANDDPDGKGARRLATERQVGEPWRHGSVASPHIGSADAKHRALVERSHSTRPGQLASQEQAAADAAVRRLLARERSSIPSGTPAQVPAPAPAKPSGQPGWLLASLGVLAAVLALTGGLVMLAARRAGRRARVGHAA
jgi:hypothetical protein